MHSSLSTPLRIHHTRFCFNLYGTIDLKVTFNDHLFSFYMSNRVGYVKSEYSGNPIGGDPSSIGAEPSGTAAQTEIRTLGLQKGNQFKYLFDYGDNLIHTVEVLEVSKCGDFNETYGKHIR